MSHFLVKFEVFEPHTQDSTLRIGIPVEVLRALVENGIGQFHVANGKLRDCSGICAVLVEAVRDYQAIGVEEGLQPITSAHGLPKYEGWLGATAGSAWWETREGRYQQSRSMFIESKLTDITENVHDEDQYRAIKQMLEDAYDAGAGRERK